MSTNNRTIHRALPYFSDPDIEDILGRIKNILVSRQLLMGPSVEEFEQKFAHMAGVKHAIAVNSGTAALEIVLRCLGVRDREVIVPTETFVASANSVILAGGRPVFAEIHRDTLCLDLADVERRIGPKTAAVMAVHMAGLIQSDINALQELCRKKNIALIEDAAHAIGASFNGRKAGGLGKAGCFSFYPTKVITTGEGGMITTDDSKISEMARSYRNHGAAPDNSMYERVSTNWRMTEISAVIGLSQLQHLDEFISKRNEIADKYDGAFSSVRGIRLLPKDPRRVHSYWNYIVLLDRKIDRTELANVLRGEFGIPIAWPYDPPCHLQPVFRNFLGTKPGDLPQSEDILHHHIALPMHVALTNEDVSYIIHGITSTLRRMVNS